jgi:glycosyltransferase involved in cell wall biosynthesis
MISVVIPSYKERCLDQTLFSLLKNARGHIELIVALDGYDAHPVPDTRVRYVRFSERRGMREAINSAVAISRGDYIMKIDGHCMVSEGFDTDLLRDIEDNWVVIPRRYDLDPIKWEVMDTPPVDYDRLIIHKTRHKFHGEEWKRRARERRDIMIDETMSLQGSCYLMSRTHWDTAIKSLDSENYGTFMQEPVEISMKTWEAGGKLMVNKHAWYAHKHRSFNRTHNVPREEADRASHYAMTRYQPYYESIIRPRFGI